MAQAIALSEPAARDPAVVGAKAAGLAAAAAAGLPVLPGTVLPLEASAGAIVAGRDVLERAGAHAAYLAAVGHAGPAVGRGPGDGPVVVRSSTPLDGDGRWSGAFASYLDVEGGDVATAVRGCWASVFATGALERADETEIDPGTMRVAVLVQPYVRFDAGGTARVRPDGVVAVVAAPGGPAGIVGGRTRGVETVVPADGDPEVDATAAAAAALARRAATAVGASSIEWGAVGDDVILLQVGPAHASERAAVARPIERSASVPAGAERVAALVTRFPGPLGDELVLPWALGADELPDVPPAPVADPRTTLAEARAAADQLAAAAWSVPADAARSRAEAAARLLREGRVEKGLRAIDRRATFDAAAAARLLALVGGLGALLVERGLLHAADVVWRLSGEELDRALDGDRPVLRRGPARWEPFVAHVVRARGDARTGTPVSPGLAAGRAHRIGGLSSLGRPGPRTVLVAPLPLPQLAPLLWHCAALVTVGGSSGAHLFEVARSLNVPAVAGVEPLDDLDAALVVVDGDAGTAAWIDAGLGAPRQTASAAATATSTG